MRELARRTPAGLASLTTRGQYYYPPVIEALDTVLVQVAVGRLKRVIITFPPRHGKSMLTSKTFPAWYVGTFPDRRIILASYEGDFAATWGRKSREVLEQYGESVFGIKVDQRSNAASDWGVAGHDGGMVCAGVGGPITGKGAHVFLIDDPIKSSKEAMSPVVRQSIWEWYLSTAYTRLEADPEGAMIIIMTRWHTDDLVGRLLSPAYVTDLENPEQWTVLNFPAIAEENDILGRQPGEALFPERYPIERLNQIRSRMTAYWWNALYQQKPIAEGSAVFKRTWFDEGITDDRPQMVRRVAYWDLAATISSSADYTAGVLLGMDAQMRLYVLDVERFQLTWLGTKERIAETLLRWRPDQVGIEQQGMQSVAVQELAAEPRLMDITINGVAVDKDKLTRVSPFAARCESGMVYLMRAAWNGTFIDELCSFPLGAHDDQVDAVGGAYQMLAALVPAAGGYAATDVDVGRIFGSERRTQWPFRSDLHRLDQR